MKIACWAIATLACLLFLGYRIASKIIPVPESTRRYLFLRREGKAAFSAHDDISAERLFEEVIQIQPGDTEITTALAEIYERQGRTTDCIRLYRIIANYDPKWRTIGGGHVPMLIKYGEACVLEKHVEEAKRVFRCAGLKSSWGQSRLAELPPIGGHLNEYRAAAYVSATDDDTIPPVQERLALLQKAVHFDPKWEDAKLLLAETLFEEGLKDRKAQALFTTLANSQNAHIREVANRGQGNILHRHFIELIASFFPIGKTHCSDFWRVTPGVLARKDE